MHSVSAERPSSHEGTIPTHKHCLVCALTYSEVCITACRWCSNAAHMNTMHVMHYVMHGSYMCDSCVNHV